MACRKYTISNNGSFTQTYTYQECNNLMWNYDFTIEPGQIRTIWLINGTYTAPATSSLSVVDDGAFPPAISPTPSSSVTPTNTPTPSITPTQTSSPTPTPSLTTTQTPTPTTSVTPTLTSTPTLTPTPSSTPPIQGFFFTLQEVGPDVVLSGTGTANLSALSASLYSASNPFIRPQIGVFSVGDGAGNVAWFTGVTLDSPTSFGSGSITTADSSTGDNFGFSGFGDILVPQGYGGGLLNGTATFTGTTLSTLGAIVGTYETKWGTSGASETITLSVI